MSHFPKRLVNSNSKVEVELDLSNYAQKSNLKNAAGVDTSDFAKKADWASLKADVLQLDIDKLKNVPIDLSSLKSKVDKLDVVKMVPAHTNVMREE